MDTDKSHLSQFPNEYAELADVVLVVENIRLPAHSQILAMHSNFVRKLLLETGPRSWQDPVMMETCLQCHTAAAVKLFLTAAYSLGSLTFPSVQQAWQFCLLADHLDCPKMLQQCKENINSSMESAQLSTSKEALDWIMTADKLGLDSLKDLCAQRIASDYASLQQEPHMQALPAALLLLIMLHMSTMVHREEEIWTRVKAALKKRSGKALMQETIRSGEGYSAKITYSFFCDEMDCPGHTMVKDINGNIWDPSRGVRAYGNYHCKEQEWSATSHTCTLSSTHPGLKQELYLPASLQEILKLGHEVSWSYS